MRKDNENTHGSNFDNNCSGKYNIIIDDDIASGDTIRNIYSKMDRPVDLLIISHGFTNQIPVKVLITSQDPPVDLPF